MIRGGFFSPKFQIHPATPLVPILKYEEKMAGVFLCQTRFRFGQAICSMLNVGYNNYPVSGQKSKPWPNLLGKRRTILIFFVYKSHLYLNFFLLTRRNS